MPAQVSVDVGELDARARLGEVPARATRLGAGPAAIVASGLAVDNEWLGGFAMVPREDCLLAYARGASSIEDVDVSVYSDDGTSLAVDEGRDVHPTVLLCPPHPSRVYVAAHVVEGEGLVAVGVQLVPRDRAAIVSRALGARGAVGQAARPAEAWPGLDDLVRAHRQQLGGAWEEYKRIALPVDARMPTFTGLTVAGDQCLDAVVVPDDDVALLDVEALDLEGRVIARAPDGIGPRTVTFCSPTGTAETLSIRPHIGRGLAAVVLARAPGDVAKDLAAKPQVAWVATPVSLDVARSARNALLAKIGYAPAVTAATGTLGLGRSAFVLLDLSREPSDCSRIDVVAGAPLALLDGKAWTDAGEMLASGVGGSSLALFACARGSARLELETHGRPGPFAVSVRPERWKSGVFGRHPLAASRMMSRAASGQDMLLEGREIGARELSLDATKKVAFRETVPPGECLHVTVGVEGDGAGIELRAFDGPDSEIDRGSGAGAASVRACSPQDQARAVDVEVRASAGRLSAVLGERLTGLALR